MQSTSISWKYGGNHVLLFGSFNGWSDGIPMKYKDNVFQIVLDLPYGTHQIKFQIDGCWCYDMICPIIDDGLGGKNNLIRVRKEGSDVTIVHISDTHNYHDRYGKLPDGDILIISGDFSIWGHPDEFKNFNEWLGKQPFIHRIVTLGNHEIIYAIERENDRSLGRYKSQLSNAKILSGETINVFGLNIYGVQWHWFHKWEHSYNDKNHINKEVWNQMPNDTDVIITHSPPKGILDGRTGSKNLLDIVSHVKPKCHLFGHIHTHYGTKTITWKDGKETIFSNASGCDEETINLINPPIVITIKK
ncbi:calcineurin-like phosphoesterase [Indivirus ILV1]|uniref:Calcineurin-like phosphoesterase n=1 Tax=Indivirus ILV1 TaxID=1977633 RepID=A0A1V0SDK2_9VIRU|nr:calcineurin-like phosphoesterase [Indivirus ILV1]